MRNYLKATLITKNAKTLHFILTLIHTLLLRNTLSNNMFTELKNKSDHRDYINRTV